MKWSLAWVKRRVVIVGTDHLRCRVNVYHAPAGLPEFNVNAFD